MALNARISTVIRALAAIVEERSAKHAHRTPPQPPNRQTKGHDRTNGKTSLKPTTERHTRHLVLFAKLDRLQVERHLTSYDSYRHGGP